jgi:hypothetical protein
MPITEDLLYYLWKFRLFDLKNLKTHSGDFIEIVNPGFRNTNAGPDFSEAKIRIGDTLWAGNVELHLNSSDWEKHGHTTDEAYDNVILHVVYANDTPIFRTDGTPIQTLELKGKIPAQIEYKYRDLMQNLYWIPCENRLKQVDDFLIKNWLSRILIERLEQKSREVLNLVNELKGSWDDAFYIAIARNFGFKTNANPFEMLARSLPQLILAKHKNNPAHIEALLFGQSGFLGGVTEDEYHQQLKAEYSYLQKKYNLVPLSAHLWKFLRLRPNNFPTVRLAQFAGLAVNSNHLFSKIIEIREKKELARLFDSLPVNPYWETHFRFGKAAERTPKQLGTESINNILLNTVAIFIFSYGKYTGKGSLTKRAVELIESLPGETNSIVNRYKSIGLKSNSADVSQALLQLKKYYCDTKKCLSCGIGVKLLNRD